MKDREGINEILTDIKVDLPVFFSTLISYITKWMIH